MEAEYEFRDRTVEQRGAYASDSRINLSRQLNAPPLIIKLYVRGRWNYFNALAVNSEAKNVILKLSKSKTNLD